jgi:hypothetical protein
MQGDDWVFKTGDRVVMWMLALCVLIMALVFAGHEIRPSDDWPHRLGTYAIAMGFVAAYGLPAIFLFPSIVVTPQGMARQHYGFRSGYVAWDDIACIRCLDMGRVRAREYLICTDTNLSTWKLRFRGDYDNVEKLIELVQAQVALRGIPVYSSRIGLPVLIDHVPLPDEPVKNLG